LFNLKNFTRILEEKNIVKDNNFPYFYSPNQEFVTHEIGNNIQLYVPTSSGCWAIKTPCIDKANHVLGDQMGPYKIIKEKN